jgi:hypothetical protein
MNLILITFFFFNFSIAFGGIYNIKSANQSYSNYYSATYVNGVQNLSFLNKEPNAPFQDCTF